MHMVQKKRSSPNLFKIVSLLMIAAMVIVAANQLAKKEHVVAETGPRHISSENVTGILQQKNPQLCLNFQTEEIDENISEKYVDNLQKAEDGILFKDVCLIYAISLVERPNPNTVLMPNVNDDFIVLCNNASDRVYRFSEEGWYDIPAWEFCFRKAFGDYKSFPSPPRLGNITDWKTCELLKGFKDDCYFLAAKTNNDSSICDRMSAEGRREVCLKEAKT